MTVLSADFHTHILSEIDDGSPSVDESIQMLHCEYEQGVTTVFLTPHFTAQQMYPDDFLVLRSQSLAKLQESIAGDACVPEIIPGAEVKFYSGLSKWEELEQLALGDTRHILIELSPLDLSNNTLEELEAIYYERDLIPVIAHVERCFGRLNRRSVLSRLTCLPVVLQYNCSFIIDKRTRNMALRLLRNHNVHLISSDCHSLSWRPPCMQYTRDLILSLAAQSDIAFLSQSEESVLGGHRNRGF